MFAELRLFKHESFFFSSEGVGESYILYYTVHVFSCYRNTISKLNPTYMNALIWLSVLFSHAEVQGLGELRRGEGPPGMGWGGGGGGGGGGRARAGFLAAHVELITITI